MSNISRDFPPQGKPGASEVPQGSLSPEETRRESRRSLFRTGFSVAPLILTLPSRSAWGETGGNGTQVTPISPKNAGLTEEQIEELRRQLQHAEGRTSGSDWQKGDPGDSLEQ